MQDETVLHALRPCFRPPPFLPIRPFLLLLFSSLPELSLPEAEVFSSSVALSFSLCVSCHVSPPVVLSHHVTSDSLPSLRILPPPYIRRAGGRKPHWRGGVSQEEEGERREERHHRPDPSERGNPDRRPPTKRRRRSVFGGGGFTSFCPSPLPYSPSPCVQPSGKTQFVCSRLVVPRYLYPHLHCTSFLRGNRPPARRTKRLLGPFSCYIVVT